MPTTEHMRAVIALGEALTKVQDADTLLRPVAEHLLDQSDTECDLQAPVLDHP
ncbi:hypothetical protein [Candidatus Corynebacterium faecigallinarum]|uniref:hypothetical protein n=1 Tax=Candidatus Corynebacterium faecigallinarum TaxID=2838528 RepID=UPI003FD62617